MRPQNWVVPPAQDASHHQDDITFLVGYPGIPINLHFSHSYWEGGQPNLKMICGVFLCHLFMATLRENPGLNVKLLVGPTYVKSNDQLRGAVRE